MARTFRNDNPYAGKFGAHNRKSVQVRVNRVNRHHAKQALVADREIAVVRHAVNWVLH